MNCCSWPCCAAPGAAGRNRLRHGRGRRARRAGRTGARPARAGHGLHRYVALPVDRAAAARRRAALDQGCIAGKRRPGLARDIARTGFASAQAPATALEAWSHGQRPRRPPGRTATTCTRGWIARAANTSAICHRPRWTSDRPLTPTPRTCEAPTRPAPGWLLHPLGDNAAGVDARFGWTRSTPPSAAPVSWVPPPTTMPVRLPGRTCPVPPGPAPAHRRTSPGKPAADSDTVWLDCATSRATPEAPLLVLGTGGRCALRAAGNHRNTRSTCGYALVPCITHILPAWLKAPVRACAFGGVAQPNDQIARTTCTPGLPGR